MADLIGMMLVRNEAGRFLEKVLAQMTAVCSRVYVLDDGSEDDTVAICRRYGAVVEINEIPLWEKNEQQARQKLWEMAAAGARPDDWILCLDADETIDRIDGLREFLENVSQNYPARDGLAFKLYDMWSPTHYRDDRLWSAHNRAWVMAVKFDPRRPYRWNQRALHCGRFPVNAVTGYVMSPLRIQHWGWSDPEFRRFKYERYLRVDPQGIYGSMEQYQSIMDPDPVLVEFEP